ncbi:MAG: HPF/RaiA family ribosome-associated protein [bacterium]|nr:HPF/RaiA family ribosome-associated protein [bacterium]MDW8164334.1 HPF/RaiA family ribosome-associated protein [Candidatus Omnitrophota bacterium]
MEIKIYSEVKINKEYEEYIKEKIEKLKRFIFDNGYVEFYIKKDGPIFLIEIYLHSKNIKVFLKEKNNEMNKGVEILLDKTKVKLRKLHDKIVNK